MQYTAPIVDRLPVSLSLEMVLRRVGRDSVRMAPIGGAPCAYLAGAVGGSRLCFWETWVSSREDKDLLLAVAVVGGVQ